jgi:cell division control protein 6
MAWNPDSKSLLLEPDVLSEEYLPKKFTGRDIQVIHLRACLLPVVENQKPLHAWLHGKPGTGKTAIAKSLVHEINSISKAGYAYVNCRNYNSSYAIMDHILNELRLGFGNARDRRVKLEKIRRHLGERPFIIILDEIDFLPNKERSSLLYSLSFGKVGLVCISEGREALVSLNGRARSRIQPQVIEFPAYTSEEITAILHQRAFMAFTPESWSPHILQKIAFLAEGDVRAAIQTLRSTAELAETQGDRAISSQHIDQAFCDTARLKKSYTLKKLGAHYMTLFKLIEGSEGILSNKLWNLYVKECRTKGLEPVAKRTYSYYLNRMTQLKLIEAKRARVRGHVYSFSVKKCTVAGRLNPK